MKLLRTVGAASVVALLILATGAGPALADAPSVTIDAPVSDTTQSAPFSISGHIDQGGREGVVTSASVVLTSNDGWTTDPPQNYSAGGSSSPIYSASGASVSFNWANVAPKYNGRYTVSVSGTGHGKNAFGQPDADQTNIVSRSFDVQFKPVPPSGVTAAKPEGSSDVTITWKPNPEPDMVGYQVYRSYNGGSAKPLGDPIPAATSPSVKDNLAGAPSGPYRYAVVAVRHARTCKSPTNDSACDTGIPSTMSAYSGSVTVQGQGAPQPTTTTTRPPTKGGGSGSGSGGSGSSGGSGGGSGSTSSGGSTGSGSKSGSGGVKLGNGGGIAPGGGDVDLRQFAGLLNGSTKPGSGSGGRNADGTYDPTLPYGSDGKPESSGADNSLVTIGGTSIPKPNEDWVRFIGAGSLATALLVHVLWFKQQVDQIPLESLAD